MGELTKLAAEAKKRVNALSDAELDVFDAIVDYLDTLPEGFFEDNSVEELNKHFGGHDDVKVTENVRAALDAQQRFEYMLDCLNEEFDDLPEREDDDDDEDDWE